MMEGIFTVPLPSFVRPKGVEPGLGGGIVASRHVISRRAKASHVGRWLGGCKDAQLKISLFRKMLRFEDPAFGVRPLHHAQSGEKVTWQPGRWYNV